MVILDVYFILLLSIIKFDLTLASKNCFLCGACVCEARMCTRFLTETETNIHW